MSGRSFHWYGRCVFGPEDEATADVEDDVDREQKLSEAMPLPGSPQKEQERKAR